VLLNIEEILNGLSGISGPSGFERPVAEKAVELMRPYVDQAYLDRFGNAVGVRRCGTPSPRRLLLDAHLDEIGLIVTGMEDGYLRFRTVGVWIRAFCPIRNLLC
jgi:endoglucanase